MAFDIMSLFGPEAVNKLLQPLQNAAGVGGFQQQQPTNRLVDPSGMGGATPGMMPQGQDPWAGMREAQVDPTQTASTPWAGGTQAGLSAQGGQPVEKKGFWDKSRDFFQSDRGQYLQDTFEGWAAGDTWQKSLALGSMNAGKGKRERGDRNQTVEWLKKNGYDPDTAKQLAGNPNALQQAIKAIQGKADPITVSKGASIYNPSTGEWITPPAGEAGADSDEWGLQPIWGKDANGNTVIGQASKSGRFKPLDTGGFLPTPGLNNVDTGTSVITRNSRTGEVISETPKNLADAEREKALGKAQGDALQQLGGAQVTAQRVAQQIEDLKTDEGLNSVLGPLDSRTPNILPGSVRAQSKIDRLKGEVFLQGFGMLKGGGAITEVEGVKAEQAMARLNQAQSPEDFKTALDEFNQAVQEGVAKLQRASSGGQGGSYGGRDTTSGVNRTGTGAQWRVK